MNLGLCVTVGSFFASSLLTINQNSLNKTANLYSLPQNHRYLCWFLPVQNLQRDSLQKIERKASFLFNHEDKR